MIAYRIIIFVCLLTAIALRSVDTFDIYDSLVSSKWSFAVICAIVAGVLVVLTFLPSHKPSGILAVRRIDKNIKPQLTVIAFYGIFLSIGSYGMDSSSIFAVYTTLGVFLVFEFLTKLIYRMCRPYTISTDNAAISLRTTFGIKSMEIKDLKEIFFDSKKQSIELRFNDGLDNFTLFRSDYKSEELDLFCKKLAGILKVSLSNDKCCS